MVIHIKGPQREEKRDNKEEERVVIHIKGPQIEEKGDIGESGRDQGPARRGEGGQ